MLDCSEDNDTSSNNEPSTTTSDKRRRKQFSVQEKKKILDEIDKGIKKCVIAKKYHISSSTLSTFIKYREKIEKSSSPFVDPYRKRVHAAQLTNIERSSKVVCEESNAKLHKIKDYSSSFKTSNCPHSDNDLHVTPLSQSETTEDRESLESDDSSKLKRHKVKRRRKQFSLQEKKIILEALDSGVDPKQIAREFGINCSTIFTFIKCKKQIEENITKSEARLKTKRLRPSPFEAIDKAVYEWILQSKCESFPVNSKLRKLALSFANSLGITNFKGSIGWLYRFKYHYGIGNSIRMKSTKDDEACGVKEDTEGTDMMLRSQEKNLKKSSACKTTSSQNTMNKIKCPCDNKSQKDNVKIRFKQRREKHKKEKISKRERKASISHDGKCTTSKPKNIEMSEHSEKCGNSEVSKKEVIGKNALEQLEETELNESGNSGMSHSVINKTKRNVVSIDAQGSTGCANTTNKKLICNSPKLTKEDSSIPFIVSASEAVSMAGKLRQFIMAHKDIPNYVQDSCDIICDYTERCVQQEKRKNLLMCSKI